MNLIAGLTPPTNGTLLCANREIAGPGPERAVVFLNHSLLPRLPCFENVSLGVEHKVLLIDEPFGALDVLTRATQQDELLKILARSHSTVLTVTHDVDEAVLLSDRIVMVMVTNGPAATIGEVLKVTLERPRKRVHWLTARSTCSTAKR